jgi:hypothetical protein
VETYLLIVRGWQTVGDGGWQWVAVTAGDRAGQWVTVGDSEKQWMTVVTVDDSGDSG